MLAVEVQGMLLRGVTAGGAAWCKVGSGVSTCTSRESYIPTLKASFWQAAACLNPQDFGVTACMHGMYMCTRPPPDDYTACWHGGFGLDLHTQLSQPKAGHVCCSTGSSHYWRWLAGC